MGSPYFSGIGHDSWKELTNSWIHCWEHNCSYALKNLIGVLIWLKKLCAFTSSTILHKQSQIRVKTA